MIKYLVAQTLIMYKGRENILYNVILGDKMERHLQRTLAMIKPDAMHQAGHIIQHLMEQGLMPIAMKTIRLTRELARKFYHVHHERPFFEGLVEFMSSKPVMVMVLQGDNAVAKHREVMGSTDSKKAAAGTIRNKYGTDIEKNAIHGSDSLENARIEVSFFFSEIELLLSR